MCAKRLDQRSHKKFIDSVATILALGVLGIAARFLGAIPMTTLTGPLPFQEKIAHIALSAAIGSAEKIPSPISPDEINLVAGARLYTSNCAVCHGGDRSNCQSRKSFGKLGP